MKTKMLAIVLAAAFTIGSVGLGTGCRDKGAAETVGEKLDRTAEKLKDKIDPPGPAEKAGRTVDRAIGGD